MKINLLKFLTIIFLILSVNGDLVKAVTINRKFNIEKDLLLVQLDCKTDVDDLHTAAALRTLLSGSGFSTVNYYVVAGTYGVQKGLYVPPNELLELAFGSNWSDADADFDAAVDKVKSIVEKTCSQGGDIWIAEAGQSDFSAELLKRVIADLPNLIVRDRIHIVQHSDWNEKVTAADNLEFVKNNTDYHKIADGNATGNGTPGFRSSEFKNWRSKIINPELVAVWQKAIDLANKYNGKDGRYQNESILAGGLDFSDLSEVWLILGKEDIKDVKAFFDIYGN